MYMDGWMFGYLCLYADKYKIVETDKQINWQIHEDSIKKNNRNKDIPHFWLKTMTFKGFFLA